MRKKAKDSNIGAAYGFFAVFFILIFISIFLKFAVIVKDSNFDGKNRFTIAISQKDNISVVSLSPKNKSVSIIKISRKIPGSIERFLEVPVDATMKSNLAFDKESISSDFAKTLLTLGRTDTNLTFIDISKIVIFTKTVPSNQILEKPISSNTAKTEIQAIVSNSFTDSSIVEEKQSIEIVNATEIGGLAARLANLISNMGGNVILITTADSPVQISEIQYTGEKNYTVKKLAGVLGFKTVKKNRSSISDVIIVIGKDALGHLQF